MKKQVIVISGGDVWNTYDEYIDYLKKYNFTQEKFDKIMSMRWKDYLQRDLGIDFEVVKPDMPNTRNAKYAEWEIWFEKIIPYFKGETIFIGHSLGANFVTKYFAEHSVPFVIRQIHLVAGCFGAGGGFDLPQSLDKIMQQCNDIIIYHSTDDLVVSYDDALQYEKALPQARLITCTGRGHFISDQFPEIIDNVKKCV